MKNCPKFQLKKHRLLAIAGSVWLIAGANVLKMGISSYLGLERIKPVYFLLSALVFIPFMAMFYKMSKKHSKRIMSYEEECRPFWNFFDRKAYIIMFFMMSMGIWLRTSGLVSVTFIAVFYTGLGLALFSAGIFFLEGICRNLRSS